MGKVDEKLVMEALNDPNFSFIQTFGDASEMDKVGQEMTRLMFLHKKERNLLKIKERERVVVNNTFERKKRASYLKHKSAPNEKTKSILVEIDTEEEKYKLDIIDQQIKEINRSLSSIKLEIDTLKAISYSLKISAGIYWWNWLRRLRMN